MNTSCFFCLIGVTNRMVGTSKLHLPGSINRHLASYVSNKRITRLPSELEVKQPELKTEGNERYLNVRLVNRNPRNLEQMLLAPKPMGFEMDSPNRHYWNKVIFEKRPKYLLASIVHYSGRTVISAASNEPPIAANLPSALGLKAAQLLGQVLAMRAFECGIHSVFYDGPLIENDKKHQSQDSSISSSKTKAFIQALQNNGIVLNEQPFIFARSKYDH